MLLKLFAFLPLFGYLITILVNLDFYRQAIGLKSTEIAAFTSSRRHIADTVLTLAGIDFAVLAIVLSGPRHQIKGLDNLLFFIMCSFLFFIFGFFSTLRQRRKWAEPFVYALQDSGIWCLILSLIVFVNNWYSGLLLYVAYAGGIGFWIYTLHTYYVFRSWARSSNDS